jgi:hypothetical protein
LIQNRLQCHASGFRESLLYLSQGELCSFDIGPAHVAPVEPISYEFPVKVCEKVGLRTDQFKKHRHCL